MNLLLVSVILLWAIVLGLLVVVAALARQIGVLHERIAPVGALATGRGPDVGESVPPLTGRLLDGGTFELAEPLQAGARLRMLLFVSAACPVCKKLIPLAKDFARSEQVQVVFVGDAEPEEQHAFVKRHGLSGFAFINGPEVGMTFRVERLPYAVLIDGRGVIASKGLVNSREHLESLVIAQETGFASVQDYLAARTAAE
ncbi:MAG: redoxin domain-containing protein [Phenylobacterium sp.]|uniref:redoxin family protein n=1 Tax=Phenylobacterium sp. TaxID=1871053 RepID=UPI0025D765F6|nr:redoxin family protein [Phenylobacterium sp.]MBI1200370.1 redoxin domain-containing protein [Phenylobacterium sp.]